MLTNRSSRARAALAAATVAASLTPLAAAQLAAARPAVTQPAAQPGAVAPAAAAARVGGVLMQQADFTVSVAASQTTTWRRAPLAAVADCTPVERFTGEGRETISFRLRPWRFTAYRTGASLTLVGRPGSAGVGPAALARVSRSGVERVEEVAGTCMGNPGRVDEGGPYDCGSRDRDMLVSLPWRRGRLSVALADGGLAPLVEPEFRTCPIHVPDGVAANDLTEISQALPLRDLLDPDLRQHVVLARRTFRRTTNGYVATTVVRWTAKLTRGGAIRG